MKILRSELRVPEIVLFPRLGLSDEERSVPQEVRLSLVAFFHNPLPAGQSDAIEGTLCYHTVYDRMIALIENRDFRLIEHLGTCLGRVIADEIQCRTLGPAEVELTLHKVRLPLPTLPQGALFSIRFTVEPS